MQKKLLGVLVVAAIALGSICAILLVQLQRSRQAERQRALALEAEARAQPEREQRAKRIEQEQARLEKENQDLTGLAHTLRAAETRQASNLTALAKRLSSSASNSAAASGHDAGPSGAETGFQGFLAKMMKDPSMRELMRGPQKAMMSQMYGPLFKDLSLAADQKQQFI